MNAARIRVEGGLRSLFRLIRDLLGCRKCEAKTSKRNQQRETFDFKQRGKSISMRLKDSLLKFNFRRHHHKMAKIIYHNNVYQYLHTRTQHRSDMASEEIQFSTRTMKIMFRFSSGKTLLSHFAAMALGWVSRLCLRCQLLLKTLYRSHASLLPNSSLWLSREPRKKNWQRIHRGSPPIFNHISRYRLLGFERIIRRDEELLRTEIHREEGKFLSDRDVDETFSAIVVEHKLLPFRNIKRA